jgi:hypothetical protein
MLLEFALKLYPNPFDVVITIYNGLQISPPWHIAYFVALQPGFWGVCII